MLISNAMKIQSIGLSFPSLRLDNDQVIELFQSQVVSLSMRESKKYWTTVSRLLAEAGAKYRYARDICAGETACQHIILAAQNSIAEAGIDPSDIDLVIYCGVGRGLAEPSNAYYYASELGIYAAECFDVLDACMSWVRSLELAQLYFASSRISRVLILTGEFHLNIRNPDEIHNFDSLRYNFPGYTIGEAATATIIEPSPNSWDFQYISRPEYSDLCTIPLEGYESYVRQNDKIGINGVGKFVSFGADLFNQATPLLRQLLVSKGPRSEAVDLYIPHAASKTAYLNAAELLGIPHRKLFLKIFEEFGNIVSSSIPAAIHQARRLALIANGSRLCLVPASAGISCACVTFVL